MKRYACEVENMGRLARILGNYGRERPRKGKDYYLHEKEKCRTKQSRKGSPRQVSKGLGEEEPRQDSEVQTKLLGAQGPGSGGKRWLSG